VGSRCVQRPSPASRRDPRSRSVRSLSRPSPGSAGSRAPLVGEISMTSSDRLPPANRPARLSNANPAVAPPNEALVMPRRRVGSTARRPTCRSWPVRYSRPVLLPRTPLSRSGRCHRCVTKPCRPVADRNPTQRSPPRPTRRHQAPRSPTAPTANTVSMRPPSHPGRDGRAIPPPRHTPVRPHDPSASVIARPRRDRAQEHRPAPVVVRSSRPPLDSRFGRSERWSRT